MANIDLTELDGGRVHRPARVREALFGFTYWLTFLLVLEPGNILRAIHAGSSLAWPQEILRIICASFLGATSTPMLLVLVRRFPIEGKTWRRNAAIEVASATLLAAVYIAISCVLAGWFLASEHRPLAIALREQFVANWTLLAFGMAGLVAIAHAVRFSRSVGVREHIIAKIPQASTYLAQVPIKARGRVTFLALDSVDWIEAQGNYLALHVGPAVHLIRESLARLESQLDPGRFVRVHRRAIVAIDRIREITPLGAGDALLHLKSGTEVRLSRGFRDRLAGNGLLRS